VWEGLPRKQYNSIDRAIIDFFKRPPTYTHSQSRHSDANTQSGGMTKATKATLVTLLLGLGDHQLLVSLALLLTIYIRLSDLDGFSAYSFKIATTTVWLTCLTHLSGVVALRHQYHSPPDGRGRAWRVAAMTVLLILLAPLLVLSNLPSFMFDPSLSFRCAWEQIPTYDRATTRDFSFVATCPDHDGWRLWAPDCRHVQAHREAALHRRTVEEENGTADYQAREQRQAADAT
jgi:hypothetical protein